MHLHFYNTQDYPTYEAAKEAGAVFICDAPAYEEEVEKWGFYGGALCDAMQAVICALRAAGSGPRHIDAVLFDGGKALRAWSDPT
jgi:hypothetical protein